MMVQTFDPATENGSARTADDPMYRDIANATLVQIPIPISWPPVPTASLQPDGDFLLFNKLVDQWHSNTRGLSSTNKIIYDDAYQEIIGFGKQALSWIFSRLEKENDHWYWALACIAHESPVPEDEEGNMPAMRRRWLNWGRSKGYVG